MVDTNYKDLSIRRQSELLNLNRSSLYYKHPCKVRDNHLSNLIVEIYSNYPIYGYRRITAILMREGLTVNSIKSQKVDETAELASNLSCNKYK